MKISYYITFIILSFTVVSFAQEKSDKTPARESGIEKQISADSDSTGAKFIDIDGDGINDARQKKGMKKRKGRMDKFIDKDGDGINDNRSEGMGWSSKGKGRGKGSGKHSGGR